MRDQADAPELIDMIYSAGFDPERWPAALAGIVDAVGATSACFSTCDFADKRMAMLPIGIDPRVALDYTNHYARIDPFMPALLAAEPARAHSDRMLVPRADMERTETYCDWAAPNGIQEAASVVLPHSGARIVALTVMRARRGDEFAPDTLRAFERLTLHAGRALRIQHRLAGAGSRMDALDRLSEGVLLVDGSARVLYANRAAEDVLAGAGALRTERGALACTRPSETAALRALIAGRGGAMRLPREKQAPLGIVVAPARAEQSPLGQERPAAFVFVSDPERQPTPPAERLRALFGLTPMQAAFAQEIARGDGIDAAAARLGISRATARTHLSEIFTKTNTGRQAELVRVLLHCGPRLRGTSGD